MEGLALIAQACEYFLDENLKTCLVRLKLVLCRQVLGLSHQDVR
jgi:hypothetical protein